MIKKIIPFILQDRQPILPSIMNEDSRMQLGEVGGGNANYPSFVLSMPSSRPMTQQMISKMHIQREESAKSMSVNIEEEKKESGAKEKLI